MAIGGSAVLVADAHPARLILTKAAGSAAISPSARPRRPSAVGMSSLHRVAKHVGTSWA